jgi:hypothetical protein
MTVQVKNGVLLFWREEIFWREEKRTRNNEQSFFSDDFYDQNLIGYVSLVSFQVLESIYGPVFQPHAHRPHTILDGVF